MKVRGKPNVDAFLDGGSETVKVLAVNGKKAGDVEGASASTKRTKKLFELPEALVTDLEQRCVDERRLLGRRVTQTEIVEKAIGTYLYGQP